jgi:polynucleotide 5'-kinase involved in rRNA processing
MNGFLNVFLAAAFLFNGAMTPAEAKQLLSQASADSLVFEAERVGWGNFAITSEQLRTTRREFAMAFGSCSFDEPISDLQRLGLLRDEPS